jgi:signal transduction histidine kinase
LWIAVTDTGIGIAPQDLPHVFERFWRAEKSRNQHTGGTGIGLAISQRLIELQGGQIEVESQLGVGSTFRFYCYLMPVFVTALFWVTLLTLSGVVAITYLFPSEHP